jgi:hypothetical protein
MRCSNWFTEGFDTAVANSASRACDDGDLFFKPGHDFSPLSFDCRMNAGCHSIAVASVRTLSQALS